MMENILRNLIKSLGKLYYRAVYEPKAKKKTYLSASGKMLGAQELCNMLDASLDMWLTTGRFNDAFEKRFAKHLGAKYALTVNSGSSANLLAISALTSPKLKERKLKKGDEVITVAAGFPTTVNPIIQNGLTPVFVDVELGTYNIDTNAIEEAITGKTKAIFIAHTLGNVFELEKIVSICEKYKLWLIEDSCDALGAKYNNKFTGTIGHIGTYSFYPAHHITMGEGGAVVTSDIELYKILMSNRDWGRDCFCPPGKDDTCKKRFSMQLGALPFGFDHKYTYSHVGYNLKITDWQASIALAQLDKLDSFVEKRKENFNTLFENLKELEEFLILPKSSENASPSWFGFVISVKPNDFFTKQELVEHLESKNIGTRQLFAGNILRQPMFIDNDIKMRIRGSLILNSKDLYEKHYEMLPNTDFVMNNTFWIGVWPGLSDSNLVNMSAVIKTFVRNKIKDHQLKATNNE